jgi:hypothetical protein
VLPEQVPSSTPKSVWGAGPHNADLTGTSGVEHMYAEANRCACIQGELTERYLAVQSVMPGGLHTCTYGYSCNLTNQIRACVCVCVFVCAADYLEDPSAGKADGCGCESHWVHSAQACVCLCAFDSRAPDRCPCREEGVDAYCMMDYHLDDDRGSFFWVRYPRRNRAASWVLNISAFLHVCISVLYRPVIQHVQDLSMQLCVDERESVAGHTVCQVQVRRRLLAAAVRRAEQACLPRWGREGAMQQQAAGLGRPVRHQLSLPV